MGISLLGCDLFDRYQIGIVGAEPATFGAGPGPQFHPAARLCLLEYGTGRLFEARDVPIDIQPGFIKDSKRDSFGDREVIHYKAAGVIIPPEVSSTLGALLSQYQSYKTVYCFINNSNPSYNKRYPEQSFSPYDVKTYSYNFPASDWEWYDGGIRCYGSSRFYLRGGWYYFVYSARNKTYQYEGTYMYPQEAHDWAFSSPQLKDITTGKYYHRFKKITDTVWMVSQSNTLSGLTIYPMCAPTLLGFVSREIFASGSCNTMVGKLNADLLELSQLDPGNSPWLACDSACQTVKVLEFQWAAFVRDTLRVDLLIPPLRRFAQVSNPRKWAELYLWWLYGVSPTYRDVRKLVRAIGPLGVTGIFDAAERLSKPQTRYGTEYTDGTFLQLPVTIKCNARVNLASRLKPENKVEILFLILQSLDIGIDATNVWELLPYSFVVDWFINTSELAVWLRRKSMPYWFDLKQLVSSQKNTVYVPSTRYVSGTVSPVLLTTYQREISNFFPTEPFDLRFSDPSDHWLEGAALIVANT